MTRRALFALLALSIGVSAGSASQVGKEALSSYASDLARLIGLSPDGTRIWRQDAVAHSDPRRFDRLEALRGAMGVELTRERPDRARLSRLIRDHAAEEARLDRAKSEQLVAVAFRLSADDRRTLGRFLQRSSDESLRDTKPVIEPLR